MPPPPPPHQIFATIGDTAKLERTVNRYKWLLRRLEARKEIWAIFPASWHVPQVGRGWAEGGARAGRRHGGPGIDSAAQARRKCTVMPSAAHPPCRPVLTFPPGQLLCIMFCNITKTMLAEILDIKVSGKGARGADGPGAG